MALILGNDTRNASALNITAVNRAIIVSETPYQAGAGDRWVDWFVGVGTDLIGDPIMALYENTTNDLAGAYLVHQETQSVVAASSHLVLPFVNATPFALTEGRYYWAVLYTNGIYYLTRADAAEPYVNKQADGSYTEALATLAGRTWGALVSNYKATLGMGIKQGTDRRVQILSGTQAPAEQHVCNVAPSCMAAGAEVDHAEFSSNGGAVVIRADGSVTTDRDGNQTFTVRTRTDGAAAWSDMVTITLEDLTVIS